MAEKKKKKHDEEGSMAQREAFEMPIELCIPEGMPSAYANHCVVQWGEHECKIAFFEIDPPMLIGTSEEKIEQAKNLGSIKARCVGRIVLAKEFAPKLLKILTEAAERIIAMHQHDEKKTGT